MRTTLLSRRVLGCVLAITVLPVGCSKSNTVNVADGADGGADAAGTKGSGDPCAGTGECAADLVCLFSRCRPACDSDVACEGGSLCWSDGETSGCGLAGEVSCEEGGACEDPLLACGLDQKCRIACSPQHSCPRSDQTCIAGACVSTTEAGYATTWGTCDPAQQGQYGCDGTTLWACDVDAPGKAVLAACSTAALCQQGAADKALTCPVCGTGGETARCKGTDAETCNQDHSGFDQSDCSAGAAQQCNPATGQCITLDIDAHEVTRAEYLAKVDTLPAGAGACANKTGPSDYAPEASCMAGQNVCESACDDQPQVCVDWCDAQAYCASIGRRLCGRIGGGMVPKDLFAEPGTSQWTNACSSGGQDDFTFGAWSGPASGQACNGVLQGAQTTLPSGSLATCQSPVSTYAGVFDLTGNVAEWEDCCDKTASSGSGADACRVRGGSFLSSAQADLACSADRTLPRDAVAPDVGFRCCGQ